MRAKSEAHAKLPLSLLEARAELLEERLRATARGFTKADVPPRQPPL